MNPDELDLTATSTYYTMSSLNDSINSYIGGNSSTIQSSSGTSKGNITTGTGCGLSRINSWKWGELQWLFQF